MKDRTDKIFEDMFGIKLDGCPFCIGKDIPKYSPEGKNHVQLCHTMSPCLSTCTKCTSFLPSRLYFGMSLPMQKGQPSSLMPNISSKILSMRSFIASRYFLVTKSSEESAITGLAVVVSGYILLRPVLLVQRTMFPHYCAATPAHPYECSHLAIR